ncbi:MAG: delta-60 repeat domain-containing protein, partial [Microcoleaceae cyanobacterium]
MPGPSLDSTFDADGIVITDFFTNLDSIYGVIIQSDGKILVAGEANNGINSDFGLARYNTDGSLDITFDSDGKVNTDFFNNNESGSIALQSDGKILMA